LLSELIPLTPRPSLPVLVSPQTHSTCSLTPALKLANTSTTEDAHANVTLSDAPLGVSLLLKTQGRHLLSLSLPLSLKKVMRIMVLRHLLPLGPPKASFLLIELPLQFSAAPSFFAPQGSTQAMSWDDQVAAEESRDLVSGVISTPQAPLSTSLMSHGSNYGTAESASQLGGGSAESGTCDVTGDHH